MPTLADTARLASRTLTDLKAVNRELGVAAGARLPGAPARGVDPDTKLALGEILRNTRETNEALRPNPGEDRSLL